MRIDEVRVGIIDVGANTVRLLVASGTDGLPAAAHEDRVQVGLGEEIERCGRIGPEKLDRAVAAVTVQSRRARKLGCSALHVLVTSPGRQAENAAELVYRLAAATDAPTRVLTREEE